MRHSFALLAIVMSVCACAPQQQAVAPAQHEAVLEGERFIADDGARLPVRAWLPQGRPQAVIVALHGFNDYSKAFALPGEYMRARGIAVYAFDQRGFGQAPEPGTWAGEENLVRDADAFIRAVARTHPEAPLFVLGESMGGAVSILTLAADHALPVRGVILLAPAVWGDDMLSHLYGGVIWAVAHLMPARKFTGRDLEIVATDNTPLLQEMSRDPLVIKATRADAIYGLVRLMDKAKDEAGSLSVPVLLLYGEKDQVIPAANIFGVKESMDEGAVFHYYPQGYHMLLRDMNREQVAEDIMRWVESVQPKR